MKIAVIAAMQLEIDDILAETGCICEYEVYGRKVYQAKYKGHEFFMGVCGVGKANAASYCQMLLDRFGAEIVINTGVAGSLSDEIGVLNMVLGTSLHYHDYPVSILQETYPYLPYFTADERLLALAEEAVPEGIKVFKGAIASGDDFIDSAEKKKRIREQTGALACEMEGAAIAQVASGAKLPFLVIRSISDGADEGLEGAFEQFKFKAAASAAQTVLGLAERL